MPRGCLARGVCPGRVSAQGVCDQGDVCPGGVWPGVSAQGGVCPGGVCGRPPAPPVDRMTDRCKNITLPQLRCGR